MVHGRTAWQAAIAVAVLWYGGCVGSGSSASDAAGLSKVGKQGADAALTEVRQRWIEAPEGWLTAREVGTSWSGLRWVQQIKEITVADAREASPGEADKANGVEWIVDVSFKKSIVREAGDAGYVLEPYARGTPRVKGRWSQWVEFEPESVRVWKANGVVRVAQNTCLLQSAKLPTAQDFAYAGIAAGT